MYDKNGNIIDRREMLRIKLKSLAEEARIIRREERKTTGYLREALYLHRINDVRRAARDAHIAYGLIKGRTIEQMEPSRKSEPNWDAVEKMLKKYGPAETPVLKKAA
jgi:hypothetical protein